MKDEFRIGGIRKPDGRVIRIHEPSLEELLELAAEKPVRGFLQVDAHGFSKRGAVIHTGFVYELRHSNNPVRLQIAERTHKKEVLRHLSEIAKVLEEDWHIFDELDGGFRPKPS